MKLTLNPDYHLYEKNGIVYCDSLQIAEELDKRHDHILRDIEVQLADISLSNVPKFGEINFIPDTYRDVKNRKQPRYLLTKDGFTFLITSYGGRKATNFKIAYIQRFNAMEAFIKSLEAAKLEFPAFTAAIMEAHEEPKNYHFSNEINMINRIVLGVDAKHYKEKKGIDKNIKSIRPYLASEEIKAIEELQRADIGLMVAGLEYEKRKEILEGHYSKRFLQVAG